MHLKGLYRLISSEFHLIHLILTLGCSILASDHRGQSVFQAHRVTDFINCSLIINYEDSLLCDHVNVLTVPTTANSEVWTKSNMTHDIKQPVSSSAVYLVQYHLRGVSNSVYEPRSEQVNTPVCTWIFKCCFSVMCCSYKMEIILNGIL